MTLQNLSKILDRYESQLSITLTNQFELLKGLQFYNWSSTTSTNFTEGNSTFNHAIGLPQKGGQSYSIFDYEKLVFDTLQSHKHVWIKKATGLGITEFMLRYMAWLCLKDDYLHGSQMCIVTGPRIDMAVGLIARMKSLFTDNMPASGAITFDTKENVIILNGVHIEAYPSHHLDAMRGIPNVSFILLDEADFFPSGPTTRRQRCIREIHC
jgi:late competence protein required for DNA uptake (superfamily II DNA/RNA helicase)